MYSTLILSTGADQTCRTLMLIAADWERIRADEQLAWVQDVDTSPILSTASLSALMQTSRCVSLAELFTYDRVIEAIDLHVGKANDPMLFALYKERKSGVDKSWASIERSAYDWLSMDLSTTSNYRDVMAYVEVRNSAMHGSGSLTKRQEKNRSEVIGKLKSIDITVDVNRLVLPANAVRKAALACHAFVAGVDRLSWSPPKTLA